MRSYERVRMTGYKCMYYLSLISMKLTRPKGETCSRYCCLTCKYKGFDKIIFKNHEMKPKKKLFVIGSNILRIKRAVVYPNVYACNNKGIQLKSGTLYLAKSCPH